MDNDDKHIELIYNEDFTYVKSFITYYPNGNKETMTFFNEKSQYHNENGYAFQKWDKNGKPLIQNYYFNGKYLTEKEWEDKTF